MIMETPELDDCDLDDEYGFSATKTSMPTGTEATDDGLHDISLDFCISGRMSRLDRYITWSEFGKNYDMDEKSQVLNWTSASVLPYMIDPETKQMYFVLGRDRIDKDRPNNSRLWSDFGGSRKRSDPNPETTAAREFYEESMGLLTPIWSRDTDQKISGDALVHRSLVGTLAARAIGQSVQVLRDHEATLSLQIDMPTVSVYEATEERADKSPSKPCYDDGTFAGLRTPKSHRAYVMQVQWCPHIEEEFRVMRGALVHLLQLSKTTKRAKYQVLEKYASRRWNLSDGRVGPPLVGEIYAGWCLVEARPHYLTGIDTNVAILTFASTQDFGRPVWAVGQRVVVVATEKGLFEDDLLLLSNKEQPPAEFLGIAERRRSALGKIVENLRAQVVGAAAPSLELLVRLHLDKQTDAPFVSWREIPSRSISAARYWQVVMVNPCPQTTNYYRVWGNLIDSLLHLRTIYPKLQGHSAISIRHLELSGHIVDVFVKQDYLEKQCAHLWSATELFSLLPERELKLKTPAEPQQDWIEGCILKDNNFPSRQVLRQCFIPTVIALLAAINSLALP